MKTKIKIVLLFLSCLPLFSFHQNKEIEIKKWSSQSKLTWDDFKGKAINSSKRAAESDCQISCKMKGENDSVLFSVETFFSITNSWVNKKLASDFILKHEQGHFDINEIFARKLRKALSEAKYTRTNVTAKFRDIQSKYFALLNKEQELYDKETEHSIKTEKQLKWNEKIESQLKELESYNNSTIHVALSKK